MSLLLLLVLLLLLLVIYKQVPVLIKKKKVLLSRVDWDTDLNERFFSFFFFPKGPSLIVFRKNKVRQINK